MEDRKLMLVALLFIAVVSVLGLVTMMKSGSTAFAWGNVYEGNGYRNCYCHDGRYVVSQPKDPSLGIYGKEVKFLGQRTQNQCAYECQSRGYVNHYWTDSYAKSPTWPRRSWN